MLSIIIVNYRSATLIADCLQSVYHFNQQLDFEIIVVDNNSEDESESMLTQKFPAIKWINMSYNAGFARGNNAGMQGGKGDVYLLLNPDTMAIDNSITLCYQQLKESKYVAGGVQLINPDNSLQISGGFFVKGGMNHLLPIPYWGSFIRWLALSMKQKVPHVAEAKEIQEVDWINGAFIMIKKETVEKAGLLDEDFFLYAEEIEWCSRLRKTGPLCIFGNLKMIHMQGATINNSQHLTDKGYYNLYDRKGLQLMVSNHLRIRKQYGGGWYLFSLVNYTWGIIIFAVAGTLHSPGKTWQKIGGYTKNVFKLWKLSLKILKNKKHFYKMF